MNYKFVLLFLVCIISLFHCVPTVLGTPIVGGSIDHRHIFKYHVSIHKIDLETEAYEYYCGGTIIHKKYVLTIAHCFMHKQYGDVITFTNIAEEQPKIIAGTNKREGAGIQEYVSAIFIPKTFNSWPEMRNDIAVAQLRNNLDVEHNSEILEIMNIGELPPIEANKEAIFCGFGYYNSPTGDHEAVLSELNQFLSVTLLGESECPNFDSTICCVTSDKSIIRTACNGDSGAGLIFDHKIVGVVYCGPRDCNSNEIPIRSTRLSLFKNQIDRAMDEYANHSDMHVARDHQAGPSNPHNEGSSRSQKKEFFHFPKFWKNKS